MQVKYKIDDPGTVMKRRQFIKASVVIGGTVAATGTGALLWLDGVDKTHLTIESALNKLDILANQKIVSQGSWDLYQIFAHCAQSVEYSMTAFPEHNSSLFKRTAGKGALSLFSAAGQMSHGLSEPIPGAPAIHTNSDTAIALDRLKRSLIEFNSYQHKLAPHFAYGELTKSEYEVAHVLHLYNHLQEITT